MLVRWSQKWAVATLNVTAAGWAQDTPWTSLKQQQLRWYCKNLLQTTTESADSSAPQEHNYSSPKAKPHHQGNPTTGPSAK